MSAPRLELHEHNRIRAAALRARRIYPGPVGEVLAFELYAWAEFGYRFGGHGLIAQLVTHILTVPMPARETEI